MAIGGAYLSLILGHICRGVVVVLRCIVVLPRVADKLKACAIAKCPVMTTDPVRVMVDERWTSSWGAWRGIYLMCAATTFRFHATGPRMDSDGSLD